VITREEMRQFAAMQVAEIDRHKYLLGTRLGHDPLQDRTMNDIAREWITTYGAGFRAYWQSCCRRNRPEDPPSSTPLANAA